METMTHAPLSLFVQRLWRAAKLDASLYEEVEADRSATAQALGVVVLSGLAAGVGTIGQFGGYGHVFPGIFWSLVGWLAWALLTYWIGAHLLPEPQTKADLGELLRTTGYSSAPGLIRVLGVLPGLTGIVFLVAAIWSLIAMVIAVRQALDYRSTWRAIGVCMIGWLVQALILVLTIRAAAV
ncbi:MAG TPA: YIP1 family protein [Nitrospiria bacterium]